MTRPYRATGKEVLRGREHIADAVDATYAQIIADALNGERVSPSIGQPESHHVTQRPDGDYHCTCGRGWDRDEGDECPGAVS